MAMVQVNLRMPQEMLLRVDGARGDVSRNLWVRRAVERALSEAKESAITEQADSGSVPSPEGVRSAAPAEQPERDGVPFADPSDRLRETRLRVSPSRPIAPRVPFRRDVKPFQRGGS